MIHPITPPPELVQEWVDTYFGGKISQSNFHLDLATRAAQWGADQELEACVEWISKQDWTWTRAQLRAARRPKPPSLKEQALCELVDAYNLGQIDDSTYDTIREALEQLDD